MVNQLLVLNTDAAAAEALLQQFNRVRAHTGCQNTVIRNRRAATLNVAQYSGSGFTTGLFLDIVRQFVDVAHMLGDRHNRVFFAFSDTRFNFGNQIVAGAVRSYRQGDAAYIIQSHTALYRQEYGLTEAFGAFVDRLVRQFTQTLDPACECVLIPQCEGRPLGSIAGVRVTSNAGHSECVRCRRREPGHPERQTQMQPPAFVGGKCPQRIEP